MPETMLTRRALRARRSNALGGNSCENAGAIVIAKPAARKEGDSGAKNGETKKEAERETAVADGKENAPDGSLTERRESEDSDSSSDVGKSVGVPLQTAAVPAIVKPGVKDVVTYGRGKKRTRAAGAAAELNARLRRQSISPDKNNFENDDDNDESGEQRGDEDDILEKEEALESEKSEENEDSDGNVGRSLPRRGHEGDALSSWWRKERQFWDAVDEVELEEDEIGSE
jgi:hypothetical protein